MTENNNKVKHKLQIKINNQVSKPSYLMTTNPDKFLQKSSHKTAMSIKERDESNPEMADIVRKILIKKRKKENQNVNTVIDNNNSMIKSRKVDSAKKYFDDIYNKKHGINKKNYFKLNQTLIYDSLNDNLPTEHNNINYFDYLNKTNKNSAKKRLNKNKLNSSCNYSCSRNSKKITTNFGNLKTEKNNPDDCSSIKRGTKKSKQLNKSLNFDDYEFEDFSQNNIQKIKIIKNNQYIVNLNSITIDIDQINKDKNIMEINCSNLDDKIINSKLLSSPMKNNNNNIKKSIVIKRMKKNHLDEINDKHKSKIEEKGATSTKNKTQSEIKMSDINGNDIYNIKQKILERDKKNNVYNLKMNNKNKELYKRNNNRMLLNKSTEHRNKYTLNRNMNDSKYNTMNNGFFSGNITNSNNKNNNKLNINEVKNQKPKNRLTRNNQKEEKKKSSNINSDIKKESKQKIKKNIKGKLTNKNTIDNKNNVNKNDLNTKISNQIIYRSKFKPSPSHSKNDSNISTELTATNKTNKKEINYRNKSINKYPQNRSLSKDCFKKEQNQKLNLIDDKTNIHCETLSMNISNKNNLVKNEIYRNKVINANEENDDNTYKNLEKMKIQNNSDNKGLISNNNSFKKEYPNMAKFLYGKKQNNEIIDEEQIKSSKNRETKMIKKIESICKKGYSGPGVKKTNQDNFFIYNNFNNNSNYIYAGVCDGHGLFGQDISTYLVNNLPQNMNHNAINKGIKNLTNENITILSNLFQETFVQTNTSLNEDERIDSSYSGSTCVSLLFTPTRICCINVGDSRGVLGKFNGIEWSSKTLSRDHKPSEPDEMNRILKNGGRVESFRDNNGNFVGPERVWSKEMDGPGLAMSRSFGDEIAHRIGVVVDPEIMEYYFLKEDKFIILGSDGIWEFISNDEVVEIVKDYYLENNIEGAIEHLYNEASKRWIMEEEVIDDITIIVIFLS